MALPLYTCPECGAVVTNLRHVLCEGCQKKADHTPAVRQSRGRAIAARKRALNQRVAAFGSEVDPALYRERIWPKLRAVKLSPSSTPVATQRVTPATSGREGSRPVSLPGPRLLVWSGTTSRLVALSITTAHHQ